MINRHIMSNFEFLIHLALSVDDSYSIAQQYINYNDVKNALSVIVYTEGIDKFRCIIGHIIINNTVNTPKFHLLIKLLCGTIIEFDEYKIDSYNGDKGFFTYKDTKFNICTLGNISYVERF